jgi:hypothetical protein
MRGQRKCGLPPPPRHTKVGTLEEPGGHNPPTVDRTAPHPSRDTIRGSPESGDTHTSREPQARGEPAKKALKTRDRKPAHYSDGCLKVTERSNQVLDTVDRSVTYKFIRHNNERRTMQDRPAPHAPSTGI